MKYFKKKDWFFTEKQKDFAVSICFFDMLLWILTIHHSGVHCSKRGTEDAGSLFLGGLFLPFSVFLWFLNGFFWFQLRRLERLLL